MNPPDQDKQPALLDVTAEEHAFFLPSDSLRKRYTSEQVNGIEFKRGAVILLVSYGVPTEVIARELQMSTRTVNAIHAANAAKVAGFRKEYAHSLARMGASHFALADSKRDQASYLQLMTGAGIVTDKALAMAQMGEMGEEKTVKEATDYLQVCQALRDRMGQVDPSDDRMGQAEQNGEQPADQVASPDAGTDGLSGVQGTHVQEIEATVSEAVPEPAPAQPAPPAAAPARRRARGTPGGGGPEGARPESRPIGLPFVDLPTKEASS